MKIMNNKRILTISLLIFISFLLVACGDKDINNSDGDNHNTQNSENKSIIENYRFLPEYSALAHVTDFIHRAIVYEDLIYFCYVTGSKDDSDSLKIVVESIKPDGLQVSQIEIAVSFDDVSIAAYYVTKQGNFAFILTGVNWNDSGFDSDVLYLECTPQGAEVISQKFSDITAQTTNPFYINKAIITDDGNIVLLAMEQGKTLLFLYDDQLSPLGQLETHITQSICQMQDGRVVISDSERSIDTTHTVLRVIDFSTGGWGETYPISITDIQGLYPAGADEPFDLYVDDGTYLIRYNITSGESTPILNWLETGIKYNFSPHLIIFSDEQLSLLISVGDFSSDIWSAEYLRLIRTARTDLPDVETITLGGFNMRYATDITTQVHWFNALNSTHQIEIVDYTRDYDLLEDRYLGEFRFLIDIITGNAPDIIAGTMPSLIDIANRGFLLDLYPLIDNDPVLNRSDFFPNILNAIETSDGSLPAITDSFSISTIIGMADMVGHLQAWTFADMLALIEQTEDSDIQFILFEWMTAERFLDTALEFSGQDYIDYTKNKANLDSEEFIRLLEISSRFPNEMAPWDNDNWTSPIVRMLRGEQLLEMIDISRIRAYQMYTGMLGDDIIALGLPTRDGGAHLIKIHNGLAINVQSPHQDAAWSFIRQFLLSDIIPDIDNSPFPIQIDLFEAMIDQAKIPIIIIDEDGNEVEGNRGFMGQGDDSMVEIKALTDAEERGLRAIVESASILGQFNEIVTDMVREETASFFAGSRSAADTARVLQNRIQTYLNERN
ncbi:MAG: hypothetical protein LBD23_02180 [Oscillospiraceae bacterium]|jgi:hypothetical protein|nr:hypothetical protein [Oscillospiraceae bacterium]